MPETEASRIPRVFISYSHDSPDHMRWVLKLAYDLTRRGIEVGIDQWDLRAGDDLPMFMEAGIREADRVLAICSDSYVRKANAGKGGVGYERMILTAELVERIDSNRVVPIVRTNAGDALVPTFLSTRLYVDFREDGQHEEKLDQLAREIHDAPSNPRPPLGRNPYAPAQSGGEPAPLRPATDAEAFEIDDPVASYRTAVYLIRAEDLTGWRQLDKALRPRISRDLLGWAHTVEGPEDPGQVDLEAAVGIVGPLITVALAGVESGHPSFRSQRALLTELLNISNWPRSGSERLVHGIRSSLAHVYHSLHGALSVSTGQVGLALELAKTKVRSDSAQPHEPVWTDHSLMGWSSGTGGSATEGWKYLYSAAERWSWIETVFGDVASYQRGLVVYYMALQILELAARLAAGQADELTSERILDVSVPPTYLTADRDVKAAAIDLLLLSQDQLSATWDSEGVAKSEMQKMWPIWSDRSVAWVKNAVGVPRVRPGMISGHDLQVLFD